VLEIWKSWRGASCLFSASCWSSVTCVKFKHEVKRAKSHEMRKRR